MVTPLSWGLLAATLAMFAVLGALHVGYDASRAAAPIANALFSKPTKRRCPRACSRSRGARRKKVAVVGDFNGWDASHIEYQAKHRGGGVWSVTAPVPIGHHRYSFVVDDSLWMADPIAPRSVDNDFGLPNSAIVVQQQE